MARSGASWLSGWDSSGPGENAGYPGQPLGLPETGPQSLAGIGRRISALFIDWLIAYGIAGLAMSLGLIGMPWLSTAVLVIWLLIGMIAVRLFGFTPGQLVCRLVVVRIGPEPGALGPVGIGRAAARGLLVALVIPPLVNVADGRALHDRVTSTAVLRR